MRRIGLTGGIAAGKSAVAARLAELGAVIIDADKLAREVVEPGTPALAAIEREFGEAVITADGQLDRAALGAIVFADRARLDALNGITHPAVRERTEALFDAAVRANPDAVIVHDIPLLVETTNTYSFDTIVVVEASVPTRVQRMVELRGMTPEDAERRIRAQSSDEDRRAIADHLIITEGTLDDTRRQVDELWPMLVSAD